VTFVACSRDRAMGEGDDQIDAHPERAERQRDGHKAYWDTFWGTDQVFYGHVLGFKGLERRAVVVATSPSCAVTLTSSARGLRCRPPCCRMPGVSLAWEARSDALPPPVSTGRQPPRSQGPDLARPARSN
jgi:hypothetical protein